MAYVSVAEWRPEQVTEWLKGLDNSIVSYIHSFSNNEVNGQQLLNLTSDELTHLGVEKLGHQELILEAVQHLRNFHYELDRENLQFLALKLSCAAHSLYNEIKDQEESSTVPTQIMADVANVIHNVKPLVSWLDRPPFSGQIQYADCKSQLLSMSLAMATSAQRDRFAERPVAEIRTCSSKLANLADSIIQNITDPMILQPATLDLATIKKKVGEDLDFFLVPSFHGIHQIGDMKLSSPAHQSGKIQQGDEIVQVNYQTVVGWSRKKVLALFEESPNDLLLTLKRRPRHVKMYGQIYMKPYRLPSRKRASPYSRWNDNLPSPRPELLTIPDFDTTRNLCKKMENDQILSLEPSGTSSSSDEEFGQPSDSQSPSSMRLYLPKPRASIQRRFTLSGPPRPSAQSEQFWRELQLERSWRSNQSNSQINKSSAQNVGSKDGNIDEMFQLRDKSASLGNSIASASSRSMSCVPFTNDRIGSVKFDLPKFEAFKSDKNVGGEKDKGSCDIDVKSVASEINCNKNTISSELDSKSALDSDGRASLSITELNKLKRNAFFNNMDCPNAQSKSVGKLNKEGSSEKVKRVIENFKSEINKTKKDMSEIDLLKSPGKVMELVENFEKKENSNAVCKSKFESGSPEKIVATIKAINDKSYYDKNSGDELGRDELPKCKPKLANDVKEQLIVSTKNETQPFDCSTRFSSSSTESCRVEVKNDGVANAGLRDTSKKYLTDSNIANKENIDTHKKPDDKFTQSVSEVDQISVSNRGHEPEDFRAGKNRTPERTEKDSDETPQMELKKNDFKSEVGTQNVLASTAHSNSAKSTKIDESNKPIPAQRKSKVAFEKNLNSSSTMNPFPLPPKPRTKISTSLLPDNSVTSTSNIQTPPEPPPRPDNTFLKSVNSKRNESVIESGKQEGKSAMNATRLQPDSSTGKVPFISAPVVTSLEPQPLPLDLKSIPSTPSSPARKLIKPKNAVQSPPSLLNPSSAEKEKPKTSGSTLENLKAMLTLGRKPMNVNSPRSIRKKNALLAKKRNVSVKDLMPYENSGFLYYRNRKGLAVASWVKYFFVLQGSNFYGFKSKESSKADLFIYLPGFTCALAEEVKSKDFPFKIYHTGTVFYFAANSKENLQQWLDCVNLAIFFQDEKGAPEAVTFSQTDSDTSDTEPEPETCFPTSPKMKKVLGSSSLPKPAGSHQNLASDSKKNPDIQRRFGSLKKLGSRKNLTTNNQFSSAGETSEVASLDRKYLRFLGQKNSPTPVPTSGFRSYRKMHPTPVAPSKIGKSKSNENAPETLSTQNPVNSRDPPVLVRKPLHSSNPSLIHPEMADYRITQERLSEFRRLRNQGNTAPNRFMTLEQFRQTMQDDNFRSNRNRAPELGGFITLEQFLLRQEEERQRANNKQQERTGISNEFANFDSSGREQEEFHNAEAINRFRDVAEQNTAGTSNLHLTNRSKKNDPEKPQVAPRNREPNSNNPGKLKNVTMYQPPPIAHSSTNQEDSIVMAFEMTLDQNQSRKTSDSNGAAEPDSTKNPECVHMGKNSKLTYQGIEYPPAFEPETYTLQHMLKNRQRRNHDSKK